VAKSNATVRGLSSGKHAHIYQRLIKMSNKELILEIAGVATLAVLGYVFTVLVFCL
jgi:hypothetical protein